jgi:hypothetical protein
MHSFIILSEHGFELINVTIVLFFLKSNIDDGFRNVVVHLFELFSLLDQNFEIVPKVYFISILSSFYENFLLQKLHSSFHDVRIPLCELRLLVVVNLFYKSQVPVFDFFIVLFFKLVLIFVEFNDWTLHSLDQRFGPADDACNWWFSSTNYGTVVSVLVRCFALDKKLLVSIQLFFVTVQNISIFSLESF